jgi:recombination protein RecA
MPLNDDALALVAEINKKFGDGTVAIASAMHHYGRITSGSLALDVILGGGWATGQWHEVIGQESSGKSTIVAKTIAANQAANPDFATLWIASETFDTEQAAAIGVDIDRVAVLTTQNMELAFEAVITGCASRSFDAVILDSYPALIAKPEDEKGMEDAHVAVGARLVGKFFRKVGSAMTRSLSEPDRPVTCFFVNQYREMIGGFSPYGPALTTPGGKAKNFAFWSRVEVKRDEWIDEARTGKGKVRVGQVVKLKTIKNKSAPPQQVATTRLFFRDAPILGFYRGDLDLAAEYFAYAVHFDIIGRRGAYYSYGDRKWQGQDALLRELRAEPDLQTELRKRILEEAAKPDRERLGAAA